MAFSAKLLCFLLLCVYFSSLPIHARESRFFSKFSSSKPNTNNVEDNVVPNKETVSGKQEAEPETETEPEPEPTFTPENRNGYGLYGREVDQGAQFTYSPEKTSNELNNGGQNSEYVFNNGNPFTRNNKENNVYEKNNYGGYDESKENSLYANNEVNDYRKNMNRFPVQQQGMSDTRFLENGKYFYDVNNEELYKDRYHNQIRRNDVSGFRGGNSREQYNQEGMDENLYRFNNFMENDNQGSREVYVP